MIDKVETIVPFFTGFYNSIFEDYWNHKDEVGKIFTDNINDDIKSILPSFSYTFEKIQSPKEYNLGTDEIYALATFDKDELLNYLIKNSDKFEEYCKNNFLSYDGFNSFLPNNAYEFVEKMKTANASDKSSFVIGAIRFALENNFGENISEDLNEETYYDIVDSYELDSLDKEDTYDDDHATEWMERNPHGYYNSEKDYGTDADENPVEEGYDDKFDYKQHDKKFQFQLLDRMRQDCEYFLGNGNRHEKFLWAGNVDDQIKAMRDLQSRLNPEWLSKEDIDRYESQMKDGKKLDEAADNFGYGDIYEIQYDGGHGRIGILCKDKNEKYYWANINNVSDDVKFRSSDYELIKSLCKKYGGEPVPLKSLTNRIDESSKEKFTSPLADTDKEVEADAENKPSEEFKKKLEKHGKLKGDGTDKLEESEYANVDTNPFRLVRQGDGCIALQRKLPDGRIERAGLFDSDEKEEALNKLAEINGVKQIDESSIVDRYSKPSEKDVKPELKNDPSVQEMVKVVLDNWDNYNDGEKATLKSAIFNASLGECGQLKKLYKK